MPFRPGKPAWIDLEALESLKKRLLEITPSSKSPDPAHLASRCLDKLLEADRAPVVSARRDYFSVVLEDTVEITRGFLGAVKLNYEPRPSAANPGPTQDVELE